MLIKHCRIKSEGCKLIVLDKSFNELTELVQFYCTNRFYKDMMLQHPVTKKLYTMAMAERLGVGLVPFLSVLSIISIFIALCFRTRMK